MVGNKQRLQALQTAFYGEVGIKHGLRKPSARLSGKAKADTARTVLNQLKTDPVMRSKLWPLIRDYIGSNPAPFANVLGAAIAQTKPKRQKSCVAIMTSKGKGSNPIGNYAS